MKIRIKDNTLRFRLVKKEVKRGKKYDGIIMDPPAFGRGADGELWKIEDHLFAEIFADSGLEIAGAFHRRIVRESK